MQIEYERGISNPGNQYRMKKLMARAEAGRQESSRFSSSTAELWTVK